MQGVQKILIKEEATGCRLDRWLKQNLPGLTQSQIEKWVRTGQLRLDGKRAKANTRLVAGQTIRVPPFETREKPSFQRSPRTLSKKERTQIHQICLYQDSHLIVLNKPTGIAVQGGSKINRSLDVLAAALQSDQAEPPRLVHRLDKDTSGVLVLARTAPTARWLTQAFRDRKVSKTYLAIVVGSPPQAKGTVQAKLTKKMVHDQEKVCIDTSDTALEAITHYRILATSPHSSLTLLELRPETGRMHQLRVHCASMGTPILGDGKYGGAQAHPFPKRASSLLLHASSLELTYPDGVVKTFHAPLSPLFQEVLDTYFKEVLTEN